MKGTGGVVVKNLPVSAGKHKRPGFESWVGKIPWRMAWQPAPLVLPRESHGQRSLATVNGLTGSDRTEET